MFRKDDKVQRITLIITTVAMVFICLTGFTAQNEDKGVCVATRLYEPKIEIQQYVEMQAYKEPQPTSQYLGQFLITYYGKDCAGCSGTGKTSSGVIAQENRTIAMDLNIVPMGSRVLINGQEYVVEDVGGAIKGNRIDMYVGTEAYANSLGVLRDVDVYLLLD